MNAHAMHMRPCLPPGSLLSLIAEATSVATALKLADAHGGIRVYLPAAPDAGHWLSALVGHEDACRIGAALKCREQSGHVLIPIGPSASARARWLRVQRLIDEGINKRQIARACGLHERTIQRHRNGGVKTVANMLAQGDLFDREEAAL